MMPRPSLVTLPFLIALASARAQVDVDLTAAPGVAALGGGVSVNAWLYDGTLPGPTIRVTQGTRLRVHFHDQLPERTTVHWHGLDVPQGMDGAPETGRPAVAAGQEFLYEITAATAGTYFFHPHVGLQQDLGLYGVLLIDPTDGLDPHADVDDTIVLDEWLNPFNEPGGYYGYLMNGKNSDGLAPAPFLVQAGQVMRLRLVNASAMTSYVVAIDQHELTVTHADGHRVVPVVTQALPIGPGERWDVLVQASNPGAWSIAAARIMDRTHVVVRGVLRYQGSSDPDPPAGYVPPYLSSGQLLSYAQLAANGGSAPIVSNPSRTYDAVLGEDMMTGAMTINGESWPNVTPMMVTESDQVELRMVNTTYDYHPMHFHGHFFRLMNTAGGTLSPPLKDTILIAPQSLAGDQASAQFTAANPGSWLYHCHNLAHMMMGMMTRFDYTGDHDQDGVPDRSDIDPLAPHAALLVPDDAASYQLGATLVLRVQWPAGELARFCYGLVLPQPIPAGIYGELGILPIVLAGASIAGSDQIATLTTTIPSDPMLSGLQLGLQALTTTRLPGGVRLSAIQPVTLH